MLFRLSNVCSMSDHDGHSVVRVCNVLFRLSYVCSMSDHDGHSVACV